MSAAGQPCQTDMAALVKSLELFGLESTAAKTIAAKLVLEQGHRGRTYLQLQLPPSAVRFVDTEECLLEAFSALEEDGAMGVLGLDCEWDSAAGRWAPVSILQVCGTMVTEPVSGCPHHPSLKAYIHDQGLNMRMLSMLLVNAGISWKTAVLASVHCWSGHNALVGFCMLLLCC